MVDPRPVYPPDFRCEKLDGSQVKILQKTGLAEAVFRAATLDREAWVARFGRLVEKRAGDQYGILYDDLVNTIRAEISPRAKILFDKVTNISTSPDRQRVALSSGEEISARLVILANGPNASLRQTLGMTRDVISLCHSTVIGFNLRPVDQPSFPFSSLSYYSERPADQLAYLTLFPVGSVMRANLMVYRDMRDPWLERFREAPRESMLLIMRHLEKFTSRFEVTGHIKIRPTDLYVTGGYLRPGLVLVGDAFSTSCPAAGTGAGKALNDVERLCNVCVPRWLASEGMGEDKIAAFYADPVKCAYDAFAIAKAHRLRALSIETGMTWQVRRRVRFAARLAIEALRQAHERLAARTTARPKADAATGAGAGTPA
jgi:2-polyprenyl-6-methoxyphenol hydroxylase-like FAD-dependent oxidoreductase